MLSTFSLTFFCLIAMSDKIPYGDSNETIFWLCRTRHVKSPAQTDWLSRSYQSFRPSRPLLKKQQREFLLFKRAVCQAAATNHHDWDCPSKVFWIYSRKLMLLHFFIYSTPGHINKIVQVICEYLQMTKRLVGNSAIDHDYKKLHTKPLQEYSFVVTLNYRSICFAATSKTSLTHATTGFAAGLHDDADLSSKLLLAKFVKNPMITNFYLKLLASFGMTIDHKLRFRRSTCPTQTYKASESVALLSPAQTPRFADVTRRDAPALTSLLQLVDQKFSTPRRTFLQQPKPFHGQRCVLATHAYDAG